jgi:hypothetical protein
MVRPIRATSGEGAKEGNARQDRRAMKTNAVSHLSLHSTGVVAVVAVLGIVGMRLLLKTAKLGLLLAAPALLYLLHQR